MIAKLHCLFSDKRAPNCHRLFSNNQRQIASNYLATKERQMVSNHLAMLVTSCWYHQAKHGDTCYVQYFTY
jgi:hypothetical protein